MAIEPRVAPVRHAANAVCLTHLENVQHGARNVTSVEIKTISVHVVGPNRQEPETESPTAHPEDAKARVNLLVPGLEAYP